MEPGGLPDCIEWQGPRDKDGYGLYNYRDSNGKKRRMKAHRKAYSDVHGEIPSGVKIRHKCDNPPCINVLHLLPGTHADNMRDKSERGRVRNQNTGKTHCDHGHEFTPENTGLHKLGGRFCRTCNRANGEKYRRSIGMGTLKDRPKRIMEYCRQGHRMSGDNLRVIHRKDREERNCRECARIRNRASDARNRRERNRI